MITPVTPAPSPILKIVPRLPGSCRFSTSIRSGLPASISERLLFFIFTTAIIPCGVCVCDILSNTLSATISIMSAVIPCFLSSSLAYSGLLFWNLSDMYIFTSESSGTSDTMRIPSTTYSLFFFLSLALESSDITCFTCELLVLVIIIRLPFFKCITPNIIKYIT